MILVAVEREMNLFKIIFSNIFEKIGRRLIGLYDVGLSGLFGLKLRISTYYDEVLPSGA